MHRNCLKWTVYLLLLAIVVAAVVYSFPAVVNWLRREFYTPQDSISDVFEGVGAFYSALAFGLLILTVLLQAYELSLQRQELQDTREVLAGQAQTLNAQNFETTFFSLLSLHNEIVRGLVLIERHVDRLRTNRQTIEVAGEPTRYEGREVLPRILDELELQAARLAEAEEAMAAEDARKTGYEKVFVRHRDLLGHYFRNLYHVIKFVDSSGVENKKSYISFVRAQLSGSELQLLFYNCLAEWGEGFRPFVTRYALFEHLPLGEHVPVEILHVYPEEAYGDSVALLHHRRRLQQEQSASGDDHSPESHVR